MFSYLFLLLDFLISLTTPAKRKQEQQNSAPEKAEKGKQG
jgi:hypothetical protein